MKRKIGLMGIGLSVLSLMLCYIWGCNSDSDSTAQEIQDVEYEMWANLGDKAAKEAIDILSNAPETKSAFREDLIVLTNAGYAVIDGHTTQACLDGLRNETGASVGNTRLINVHSASTSPLWFSSMKRIPATAFIVKQKRLRLIFQILKLRMILLPK